MLLLASFIVWGQGLAQSKADFLKSILDADSSYLWVPEKQFFHGNLYKFFSENLKYPIRAKKNRIEGRVTIRFIIEEDGSVSNVKTVQGIGSGCDEEAERLIRLSSGKWSAGKYEGKSVRTKISQPIFFKLSPKKK